MVPEISESDIRVAELRRRRLLADAARGRTDRSRVAEAQLAGAIGAPPRRGPWPWVRMTGSRAARLAPGPASEIREAAGGTAR